MMVGKQVVENIITTQIKHVNGMSFEKPDIFKMDKNIAFCEYNKLDCLCDYHIHQMSPNLIHE